MTIKEIIKEKKGTVIDVRNASELREGAIPGAVNIPLSEIPYRLNEINAMNGPLVLYCRSGSRSGMALSMLRSAGVKKEMYNGGGYYDMLQYVN